MRERVIFMDSTPFTSNKCTCQRIFKADFRRYVAHTGEYTGFLANGFLQVNPYGLCRPHQKGGHTF